MLDKYEEAERVLIWLGEDTGDVKSSFRRNPEGEFPFFRGRLIRYDRALGDHQ